MEYARFSICITPSPDSDLARLGRHWLGWDLDQGAELPLLKIEDLSVSVLYLTARLRRFGFQAPLTGPIRLAGGHSPLSLHHTAQALSAHLDALEFPGLHLSAEGAHLSLRPIGDTSGLLRMRNVVERVFAAFSAPALADVESSDRRRSELTTQQMKAVIDPRPPADAPPVPVAYALSRTLPQQEVDALRRTLLPILSPNLPRPYRIGALTLCGEDSNGWFHAIHRYPLAGARTQHPAEKPTLTTADPHIPLWS